MSEIPKLIFADENKKLIFEDIQPKLIFADEFKKLIFDIDTENLLLIGENSFLFINGTYGKLRI